MDDLLLLIERTVETDDGRKERERVVNADEKYMVLVLWIVVVMLKERIMRFATGVIFIEEKRKKGRKI